MSLIQSDNRGKIALKTATWPSPADFPAGDGIEENQEFFYILSISGVLDLTAVVPNGGGNPDGYTDGDKKQFTVFGGDVTYTDPFTGFEYTFKPGDILCLCYDADQDQWIVTG